MRPINNIVDITNYVLLEYAQPLHAFDLARLGGPEIHRAPRGRAGEQLLCLDGVERSSDAGHAGDRRPERPVALAGIIGGEETAVTAATTDILLEAATFDGASVRADLARTRAADRGLRALREEASRRSSPWPARGAPHR